MPKWAKSPTKHLAGFLAGRFTRQHKGFAAKSIPAGKSLGTPARDIGGTSDGAHDSSLLPNLMPELGRERVVLPALRVGGSIKADARAAQSKLNPGEVALIVFAQLRPTGSVVPWRI